MLFFFCRNTKNSKNFQILGPMPEWLKGADCKSAGDAYVGSNPTRPIFLFSRIFYLFKTGKNFFQVFLFVSPYLFLKHFMEIVFSSPFWDLFKKKLKNFSFAEKLEEKKIHSFSRIQKIFLSLILWQDKQEKARQQK